MKLLRCGLIGALLLLPGPLAAQVYKCVDERGRTHYSDKPGPGCKQSAEDVRRAAAEKKSAAKAAAKTAAQPGTQQARQTEPQDRRTLEQRCASMRRELVRLAGSQRVASVSKKGEVAYQEDPTRERRLAQLQEEMRRCP